jgi:hypothetical protein
MDAVRGTTIEVTGPMVKVTVAVRAWSFEFAK